MLLFLWRFFLWRHLLLDLAFGLEQLGNLPLDELLGCLELRDTLLFGRVLGDAADFLSSTGQNLLRNRLRRGCRRPILLGHRFDLIGVLSQSTFIANTLTLTFSAVFEATATWLSYRQG